MAVDPQGNVTAVWRHYDGVESGIWSNRWTPTGGWGTAGSIGGGSGGYAPYVAVDPSGNVTAVWRDYDGIESGIWSNRWTPTGGWGTAVRLAGGSAGYEPPRLAVDPDGNTTAVWSQRGDSSDFYSVWSNRWTPSSGWGTAAAIGPTPTIAQTLPPEPHVAVDPDGNATAVWSQRGDGSDSYSIWSNRWTPTGGWGTAVAIEAGLYAGNTPELAVDPQGNVTAAWSYRDGPDYGIWSNRWTPTGGWGTAVAIEAGLYAGNTPQLAVDPQGNVTAVWQGGGNSLSSSRFE